MPTPREFAVDVVRTLRDAGHEALFAGGCVRDELLGVEPKDYDVATSARPEQVRRLFRRTVAVGAAFGVVEVLGPHRLNVQVATFRSDGAYIDGRRPESVVFCSAEQDAQRRDFTINGMFFDPLRGELLDYIEIHPLQSIFSYLKPFLEYEEKDYFNVSRSRIFLFSSYTSLVIAPVANRAWSISRGVSFFLRCPGIS